MITPFSTDIGAVIDIPHFSPTYNFVLPISDQHSNFCHNAIDRIFYTNKYAAWMSPTIAGDLPRSDRLHDRSVDPFIRCCSDEGQLNECDDYTFSELQGG